MVNFRINDENLSGIEGVIFDKDGTLTDSHVYWAEIIRRRANKICKFFELRNYDLYKDLTFTMGLDIGTGRLMPEGPIAIKSRHEVISSLMGYLEKLGYLDTHDTLVNIFKEVSDEFVDVRGYIEPIESCCRLVRKLKEFGVKMSLLTSDTTSNAEIATDHLGLSNYFDLILGTDKVNEKKSSGKTALYACECMSLLPEKVIAIGDTEVDYIMSQEAGLGGCILVSTGQVPVVELSKRTKFSVSSLEEVDLL